MTVIQKTIGRLPVNLGDYDSTKSYGKKNRVLLYGCEWESKVENNTYTPASLNTTTGVITPDTTHWKLISGSYNTWLIDNGYKKVDAANVKDGNNTQHEINNAVANDIGTNSTPSSIKGRVTNLESAVGSGGSVDSRIASAVNTEKNRAEGVESGHNTRIEALETAVGSGGSVDSRISSAVAAEAARAQGAESALQNNIEALTQSNIVVVADHTSVSSPDPLTIYREQGTNTYSDWMYQNGSWMKMAKYDNAIDDEPTPNSDNLVKSGGVYSEFSKADTAIIEAKGYLKKIMNITKSGEHSSNLDRISFNVPAGEYSIVINDVDSGNEGFFLYANYADGTSGQIAYTFFDIGVPKTITINKEIIDIGAAKNTGVTLGKISIEFTKVDFVSKQTIIENLTQAINTAASVQSELFDFITASTKAESMLDNTTIETGDNVGDIATFTVDSASPSWRAIKLEVNAGDVYFVNNGYSGSSPKAVTVTDISGVIKRIEKTAYKSYTGLVTIEENGFLVVNGTSSVNTSVHKVDIYNLLNSEIVAEKDKQNHTPTLIFAPDFTWKDSFATELEGMSASLAKNTVPSDYLEKIYAKIDALIADNPDYITKYDAVELANQQGLNISYPVYANGISEPVTESITLSNITYDATYDITPAYKTYIYKLSHVKNGLYGNNIKKRTIFITACTHGWEKAGSFDIYLLMKRLCEDFAENDFYMKLRSLFDIWIIPCLNGYGIYHGLRTNARLVNINRNAPSPGWSLIGTPGHKDFSGEPNSEFETKLVVHFIDTLKPDIYFDHHNFTPDSAMISFTSGIGTLPCAPYFNALVNFNRCAIKYLPQHFGEKFNIIQSSDPEYYPNGSSADIGELHAYAYSVGIQFAFVLETDYAIPFTNGEYTGYTGLQTNTDNTYRLNEYILRSQLIEYCNAVLNMTKDK